MVRIALDVISGFFAWVIVWVGVEKILVAILPQWYGAPQLAFQEAIEKRRSVYSGNEASHLAYCDRFRRRNDFRLSRVVGRR